jgi:hypothetical protein
MSDKVVMSDEQFEKLLKAIAEVGRANYPHVCPPCLRVHVPQYNYLPWIPNPYSIIYTTGGTPDTIKVF